MTLLPTLSLPGPLTDALGAEVLNALGSHALAAYLRAQRWFGAKGREMDAARVHDAVRLPWEGIDAAIVRVDVTFADRGTARYLLPVVLCPTDETARARGAVTTRAAETHATDAVRGLLAQVRARDGTGLLFDGVHDADFRARLGAAFAGSATYEAEGTRLVFEGSGATLDDGIDSRVGGAEQSNTSIIFGERAILKLFRKLAQGENPDVEIARFLTRVGFPHTPRLLGALRIEDAEGASTAGMLQTFVPGSTDAWTYALERGRAYFRAPATAQPANDFLPDAEKLGRVTREMHDALASDPKDPAFAPQPADRAEVARWADATRQSVREGLALLADRLTRNALPAERAGEAKVLVTREAHFLDLIDRLLRSLGGDAGQRIRHHGDYHLGQVLHASSGGFLIIDFEGEPARPLAERRAPHSPLRDVAGMLRSFAYAAATLATEARQSADVATTERRAGRWERDTRQAFLDGYLGDGTAQRVSYLPGSPEGVVRLTALFEIEKAFYELAYELNNRPEWVWIPMRGVSKVFATVDV
jgi:trehalose synthase-fused probable maltokinase